MANYLGGRRHGSENWMEPPEGVRCQYFRLIDPIQRTIYGFCRKDYIHAIREIGYKEFMRLVEMYYPDTVTNKNSYYVREYGVPKWVAELFKLL